MATTAADTDLGCEAPWAPGPVRVHPGVRVTGALLDARGAVSTAAGVSTTALSNDDLTTAARELAALQSQVEALSMAVLHEAKDRGQQGPVGDEADTDPAAWLGKLTGDPTEVLRGGLWIADSSRPSTTTPGVRWRPGRCGSRRPRSWSVPPNAPPGR